MRRFSQRNPLVTLSDINLTPLMDLVFVLLIIFVITTPLLEQGINLSLPVGGVADAKELDPKNVRVVDVGTNGFYYAGGRWWYLEHITAELARQYRANPQVLVYVRADETTPYKHVAALLNQLERGGVSQVSLRTAPPK